MKLTIHTNDTGSTLQEQLALVAKTLPELDAAVKGTGITLMSMTMGLEIGAGAPPPTPPPPPTTGAVPTLTGLTQAQSIVALTTAGLILGTVTTAYSDTIALNAVLGQVPAPDAVVDLGTAVDITLSLGAPAIFTTLADYSFTAGWAKFGLPLPEGVATDSVNVTGGLGQYTKVLCEWPDGSIKHCIVVSYIPTAGPHTITTGPPTAGSAFVPVWPSVVVTFTIGTDIYTATLPAYDNTDNQLSCPFLDESRVIVTPLKTIGGTPHPLLTVVFDVRSFQGGKHVVDVQVYNTKDITAGNAVSYDVAMSFNGSPVYSLGGFTHDYLQIWRQVIGNLTPSFVTPDFSPFYESGAIPHFLSTVNNPTPNSSGTQFNPLGYGDMSADMAGPGGRPEIGPYPNWIAYYLVHKTKAQFDYMIASANLAGSWRGAITEADGKTLINLNTYPTYWLDGRAGTHAAPNMDGFVGPNATRQTHNGAQWPGGWSNPIENAHHPSLNYVPYLITGDRFHLDMMKFWANFTMLSTWPAAGTRQTSKGILIYENQARGIGWSLRTIADVAAYAPDADPMKTYFALRLGYNLTELQSYAAGSAGGFLHSLFNFKLYGTGNAQYIVTSLWANSYIAWALDHIRELGFSPTNTVRDRIVATQIVFYSSDPDYPKTKGGPYYPTIGDGTTLYTTMAQINAGCVLTDDRTLSDYWPEARLMLAIGAREGLSGAQAALNYLLPLALTDINFRAGFAVDV